MSKITTTIPEYTGTVPSKDTQTPTEFDSAVDELLQWWLGLPVSVNTWGTEVNTVRDEINTLRDETESLKSTSSSILSQVNGVYENVSALSNYVGEWTSGSDYSKGVTVSYMGGFYKAKNNITNSTVSPDVDVTNFVRIHMCSVVSESEFEARAEQVRRLTAGSGFVEWGKHYDTYKVPSAEGMWILDKNKLCIGYVNGSGISKIDQAIGNINGYLIKFAYVNTSNAYMMVKLPPPPSSPDQLYRQDLVFLEVWHEKISEKDVVFPYGNTQFGATSYNGISTTLITDLGINEQYSWFGVWESDLDASERTVGRGIKWSTLSEDNKKKILADPWNNIYLSKYGEFVQVRYRVRVVPSLSGADYENSDFNLRTWRRYLWAGYNVNGVHYPVIPRGVKSEITEDCTNSPEKAFCYVPSAFDDWNQNLPEGEINGLYWPTSYQDEFGYNRKIYAITIALVARCNIGAYHPTYNPNGSSKFTDGTNSLMWWEVTPTTPSFTITDGNIEDTNGDGTNDLFQFYVAEDQTSEIKKDYFIEVSGSTSNDGRYWVTDVTYDSDNNRTVITVMNIIQSTTFDGNLKSDFGYVKYCFDNRDTDSGTIGSTNGSGRPDGLFADEINEGQVKDLRNYALKVTDYNRLLDKEFEWLLNGKIRGWEGEEGVQVCLIVGDNGWFNGNQRLYYWRTSKRIYPLEIQKLIWYSNLGQSWSFPVGKLHKINFLIYNKVHIYNHNGLYVNSLTGNDPSYVGTPASFIGKSKTPKKNLLQNDVFTADFNSFYSQFDNVTGFALKKLHFCGDYEESFIPTDDFSATVDSSDNTKCTISGDKTYAIKKNARLFYRGANGYGVRRVKSVSYDGTNTTVICDGALGNVGDSINVSTCIGSNDGTKQVYVVKLSRKPKDANSIKVLIKKADGTWYSYNSFNAVSVYNISDIQTQINNTTGAGYEIRFNSYLNWLSLNISELYSTLGYTDVDDFKQNAVIEVYYTTQANPLSLTSGSHDGYVMVFSNDMLFRGFDKAYKVDEYIGKIGENTYYSSNNSSYLAHEYKPIIENPDKRRTYYPGYQVIKVDFPSQIYKANFGAAILPVLLHGNGKLYLNVHYNEVIYDVNAGDVGWEGVLLVADYETVSTDANGNKFIVGQKWVELPYFVDPEDQY